MALFNNATAANMNEYVSFRYEYKYGGLNRYRLKIKTTKRVYFGIESDHANTLCESLSGAANTAGCSVDDESPVSRQIVHIIEEAVGTWVRAPTTV